MAKRKISATAYKKKNPTNRNALGDDSIYEQTPASRRMLAALEDPPEATPQEIEVKRAGELKQLQGLLSPENKAELGPWGTDVDIPPSPYPFKNPVAMTKPLDDSLRGLRTSMVPGAGTARPNIINDIPNPNQISQLGGRSSRYTEDLLKGNMHGSELSLLGSAAGPATQDTNPNVYINTNPKRGDFDRTMVHELSHRNKPATDDGFGDEFRPGAEYVNYLYNRLKGLGEFASSRKKREDKEKSTESAVEEIARRLREAGIDAKVQKR